MKKLNNRGFTLIEMLLALAILAIFMVCVTAFVASSSKSTKQTKKQVKVQQDAQEVYDTIFDSVMQATALIINTKELASGDGTASGSEFRQHHQMLQRMQEFVNQSSLM